VRAVHGGELGSHHYPNDSAWYAQICFLVAAKHATPWGRPTAIANNFQIDLGSQASIWCRSAHDCGDKARDTLEDTLTSSHQIPPPPRAAAVAGVIFSVLMVVGLVMVRLAIPTDPAHPGAWLTDPVKRGAVTFALNLVPFAGIAFLWFIAVIRNRLGKLEDQFFATVVMGSGLMFVVCLFGAAAVAGAVLQEVGIGETNLANGLTYYSFARGVTYTFLNIFAIKMAAVFMFSTSTIVLRTNILARWVAYAGFACGLALLVIITKWRWIALLFPLWMLLVSVHILIADLSRPRMK
jgi:hypothetical protein